MRNFHNPRPLLIIAVVSLLLDPRPVSSQERELLPKGRAQLESEASRLNNEAVDHYRKRQYKEARRLLEQVLANWERLYPNQDHPNMAKSLANLAGVLAAMGEHAKALPYCERSVAMWNRLCPDRDDPRFAGALNNLAAILERLKQPARALPHCERALAMRERLYPKRDHRDIAQSLNKVGALLNALGHPRKALPHCERALAMRERLYKSQDHVDVLESLNRLGMVLHALHDPGMALAYSERALGMCRRLYVKSDHARTAACLSNVATIWAAMGEPGKALPYSEEALAMYERLHPKDNPRLVQSLDRMGQVLLALGQLEEALPYHERALAMSERLHSTRDHVDVVQRRLSLGEVLEALGQGAKALAEYERALVMTQRLYPKQDHPELEDCLSSVGTALLLLGKPAEALDYQKKALAMCERLYCDRQDAVLAFRRINMGLTLRSLGESAEALGHFQRALRVLERFYAKHHSTALVAILYMVGTVTHELGEPADALPYFERALAIYRNVGERDYTNEAQALSHAEFLPHIRNAYLSATDGLQMAERSYSHVWRSKAAITRILQGRHAAVRVSLSQSHELRGAWEELVHLRGQLTFWLLKGTQDSHGRDSKIRELTKRKHDLERRIAKAVPEWQRREALDRFQPVDMMRRLSVDSAFVDIIRYNSAAKGKVGPAKYVAFVLPAAGKLHRVELGPAASIDLAVDLWRQAVSGWLPTLNPITLRQLENKAEEHAAELRRLVWDPIAKHLPRETRTVYIAPDGNLARFAFAALPGAKPGTVLLQDMTIAYVPHGPFLLERLIYPPRFPKAPGSALAIGGIRYDLPGGIGAERWKDLKAAAREIDDIKRAAGGRKVLPLSGWEASTGRVKRELPKVDYAHFITHGFFAEDDFSQERKRWRDQWKTWKLPSGRNTTELVGLGARSPLIYTGLVLAGANMPEKAGAGGGILSGEMIVDLPLEGLRLAVLSACETGLGELTGGEGVRNLQLAFHLAGCPDVIASLWQVNDRATAVLMAKFYHELWVKNRPPVEALREAQLFVYLRPDLVEEFAGDRGAPRIHETRRQEILERGITATARANEKGQRRRAPTKLWAAFMLSGTGQ
jgi:tetratricopeptide (TPR) repeat protein/CHAT domain-containing protein